MYEVIVNNCNGNLCTSQRFDSFDDIVKYVKCALGILTLDYSIGIYKVSDHGKDNIR